MQNRLRHLRHSLRQGGPSERGQALVLIALAFIGLAAFIGLTVDAGILFAQIGQLRRGVDAASLAAANQFREGRAPSALSDMATEMLKLNGLDVSGVAAKICVMKYYPNPVLMPELDYHDPTVCPDSDGDGIGDYPPNPPFTKEVRVEAQLPVFFAFLPIIGWDSVTISADAISEAASVDLVLVLDNSGSMAFDLCDNGVDDDGELDGDDCPGVPDGNTQQGSLSDADAATCNAAGTCQPFEDLRDAAKQLAAQMYFPYDRMAVVTYSLYGNVEVNLADGDNLATVEAALDNMEVALPPLFDPAPGATCHYTDPGNKDPRGCTSTNTAEGLLRGANLLADPNEDGDTSDQRKEAVWIIILLSDGGANAARDPSKDPTDPETWFCPGEVDDSTWVLPFCRDEAFETSVNPLGFDAEDAAYDAGLFAGCPDEDSPEDYPECDPVNPGGNNSVVFTIGLGDLMWNSTVCDTSVYTSGCDEAAGEDLLRAIADIGDDGDPGTSECNGKPNSTDSVPVDCGNYYFAESGGALDRIFEAIASRIFTRITH